MTRYEGQKFRLEVRGSKLRKNGDLKIHIVMIMKKAMTMMMMMMMTVRE
jgi:hypothetical protein